MEYDLPRACFLIFQHLTPAHTEGRTAERCNKNNPCFIIPYVAQVSTYQLSLGVTSAFFSFISGTHHLLAAIRKDTYAKLIEEGVVTWRWIDYAFSSPLMFLILLILWNSPPDLKDIIFGFAVQFMIIVVSLVLLLSKSGDILNFLCHLNREATRRRWLLCPTKKTKPR